MDVINIWWYATSSGNNGHDGILDFSARGKQRNGITVTFGHLASINTWDNGDIFYYQRLRQFERRDGISAESMVKLKRDISGILYMLFLILADRNNIGIVKKNIRSH